MKTLPLLEIGLTLFVVMVLGKLEAASDTRYGSIGGHVEDELNYPFVLVSESNITLEACLSSQKCKNNKGICQDTGTCKGYVAKGCYGGCSCCVPACLSSQKCKKNKGNCQKTGTCKGNVAKGCYVGCSCCVPATNATVQLPVGEDCCNLSTTYNCSGKGGSCIPKNDTCIGNEYSGSLYCLISHLESCKCCVPIDCSAETLDPCKALNGTCIGADETCDALTHSSVNGPWFCRRNYTCKCCYPIPPAPECPCGQDVSGGCKGYEYIGNQSRVWEFEGECMKNCTGDRIPLLPNKCPLTGGKDCQCCGSTNCSAETLDPCKALNGTCIGADKTCDALTHLRDNGTGFCRRNDTCKCCYPIPPAPECRTECTSPWFNLGDQCFLWVKLYRNWASARAYCGEQAPGADLAQLNDIKALAGYLCDNRYPADNQWYWLGGSDLIREGDWRWVNGTVMDLTSGWDSGNPNPHGGEDCLCMYPRIGANSLHDGPCAAARPFLCEQPCP